MQRRERLRREEPVAGALEDACAIALRLGKRAEERRLPDAGLAAHEHESPTTRPSLHEMLREQRQEELSLSTSSTR